MKNRLPANGRFTSVIWHVCSSVEFKTKLFSAVKSTCSKMQNILIPKNRQNQDENQVNDFCRFCKSPLKLKYGNFEKTTYISTKNIFIFLSAHKVADRQQRRLFWIVDGSKASDTFDDTSFEMTAFQPISNSSSPANGQLENLPFVGRRSLIFLFAPKIADRQQRRLKFCLNTSRPWATESDQTNNSVNAYYCLHPVHLKEKWKKWSLRGT